MDYTAWLSPTAHLAVLRAFREQRSQVSRTGPDDTSMADVLLRAMEDAAEISLEAEYTLRH
jgi:hypothetical protein